MIDPARRPREISMLPLGVALLVAAAALFGLLVDDLYRDPRGMAEMYRGYDLVALLVGVPALVVTSGLVRGGSVARLVRLGALGFTIYNAALYVFGASFNDLFLLHVAVLTLATVALGRDLVALAPAAARAPSPANATRRVAAGALVLLALGLGAMWVFYSLRFALTDGTPGESELVVPIAMTHLGYALDLGLLVPLYFAAAVQLWRDRAWGLELGALAFVAGLGQQLAYMSALVFQSAANVRGATAFDPAEPFVVAVYVLGAVLLLRRVSQ
jgi:hypothetical protein